MLPNQLHLSEDTNPKWLRLAIFVLLALVAGLHIFMVFKFEVNWDEFFLLDWVYKWNAGELDLILQTIYFRAFSWLPLISENEVSQIIAARVVMLMCLMITSGFIYSLCRKFTTVSTAALSLLFFLTMSFVFRNATSFRSDQLVITVLMGILWCLMTPELTWKRVWICGAMLGLAGMITIKAVFYVPIVAMILLAHWGHSKWKLSILLRALSMGGLALLSFGVFYSLHGLSINEAASSTNYLTHSTTGSLFEAGLFPTLGTVLVALKTDIILFILIVAGFLYSVSKTFKPRDRWVYMAAASFIFPLLTIIFYRHTFAYFYTFMLAPATVLVAISLSAPLVKKSFVVTAVLLGLLTFNTATVINRSLPQNLDDQKQILNTVHTLFPRTTPYIDRCAMVSSYPKSGLFMSHWMMSDYYKKDEPIMESILKRNQPKFILANIDSLDLDNITDTTGRRFLEADEALLQQNYIHHWGVIYVAGKTIKIEKSKPHNIDMYITGPYGVESKGPLNIDGTLYQPGDIVDLEQGPHILHSDEPQTVTLRWNKLKTPNAQPSNRKLFHGF